MAVKDIADSRKKLQTKNATMTVALSYSKFLFLLFIFRFLIRFSNVFFKRHGHRRCFRRWRHDVYTQSVGFGFLLDRASKHSNSRVVLLEIREVFEQ